MVIGTHLLADFYGVSVEKLNDTELLRACFGDAACHCRLTPLQPPVMHPFAGGGVTGFILLAESHIALHTYPEHGYMALDIFSCGAAQPQDALEVFRVALLPRCARVSMAQRGNEVRGNEIWENEVPDEVGS